MFTKRSLLNAPLALAFATGLLARFEHGRV